MHGATINSEQYLRPVRSACTNVLFPICCCSHLRRDVVLSRLCHCPQKKTKLSTYLPFITNWYHKCSQWLVIVDGWRANSLTRSTIRRKMGCCSCSNQAKMIILNCVLHYEICWEMFSPVHIAQTAECRVITKCGHFITWNNISNCGTAAVTVPNNRL